MSSLSDKVSYLRGLAEGMKLDESSNEGKLLAQIIGVLGEVSEKIDALDEAYDELSDYVECIDDDLETLELQIDEDDDDDDDDFDDLDFDFDDDDDDDDDAFEYIELDDDDEDDEDEMPGMYAGCLCSECGGMFSVDVNYADERLFICPHCSKRVKAVQMNCQNVPVAEASEDDGEDKGDDE